jgi:hypothetical protein
MNAFVEIRTLTTPQELFSSAAEEVIRATNDAVAQRGRFTIALSGGSTPKSLFNLLATNAKSTLPWDRMFFFSGETNGTFRPPMATATIAWRTKPCCRRFLSLPEMYFVL